MDEEDEVVVVDELEPSGGFVVVVDELVWVSVPFAAGGTTMTGGVELLS